MHMTSDAHAVEESDKNSTRFYTNGSYLEKNPDWHVEHSLWKADQVQKLLSQHSIEPSTACDVGCGAGAVLATLEPIWKNTTLTGFDISPDCLALARRRQSARLTFKEIPVTGFFDVMLVLDVIEHVEDYFQLLRELRSHAKYKVFHIPLDLNVHSLLRNVLTINRSQFGHIHYFTKESALDTLKACGYQIVDWHYTPAIVDLGGNSLKESITRRLRKLAFSLSKDYGQLVLGGYALLVLAK